MVRRRAAAGSAPGFALAEVLVALVVLAIGVLGAVATATLAVRTLRAAAEREAAVRLAATVLDSLLQVAEPAAGEWASPRYRLRWTVRPAGSTKRVAVDVEYRDGAAARRLRFEALHGAPLPRIEGEP